MPKSIRKLRSGFTTGTAAAAATKAALMAILGDDCPEEVGITLLTGDTIHIRIHHCRLTDIQSAVCTVIKDAGDDPDITHGAEIGAKVDFHEPNQIPSTRITITGGLGVGRITKPGLEMPPGCAAINPGPRKMINQAIESVLRDRDLQGSVNVEVFVPKGEVLAQKTLNARLGIIGGISILGTTGVVRPLSHAAYIATVKAALSVAKATGQNQVVLATGRRSERFAEKIHYRLGKEAFIQIGDYFKDSIEMAANLKLHKITLAVFFGKALKMAQGIAHTHASSAQLSLAQLSRWAYTMTNDAKLANQIGSANTARHAFDLVYPKHPEVVCDVGKRIVASARKFSGTVNLIQVNLFDYSGQLIFDSDSQQEKWPRKNQ